MLRCRVLITALGLAVLIPGAAQAAPKRADTKVAITRVEYQGELRVKVSSTDRACVRERRLRVIAPDWYRPTKVGFFGAQSVDREDWATPTDHLPATKIRALRTPDCAGDVATIAQTHVDTAFDAGFDSSPPSNFYGTLSAADPRCVRNVHVTMSRMGGGLGDVGQTDDNGDFYLPWDASGPAAQGTYTGHASSFRVLDQIFKPNGGFSATICHNATSAPIQVPGD